MRTPSSLSELTDQKMQQFLKRGDAVAPKLDFTEI
jgi:hypothetical protein